MACGIAFKEWQVICDALASGRQTILLRKGGIHEGRGGFSFAHEEFFLFPTRFHAQGGQVREGVVEEWPEWRAGDHVCITHHARAHWAVTLTDWEQVKALWAHHIYTEATVRERFDWQGGGMETGSIHAALVRVRALAEPWELVYGPSFGGCRSWIKLPAPPAGWREASRPVLEDAVFSRLAAELAPLAGA